MHASVYGRRQTVSVIKPCYIPHASIHKMHLIYLFPATTAVEQMSFEPLG